ncbi:hypothetical protein RJT34_24815 [Clitoria ternatea]|uniref:Uncharacterized protein n=1 Tax=Clitoria ternatea TaxID=43366 RepID=A0AAN9IG96_CLITE
MVFVKVPTLFSVPKLFLSHHGRRQARRFIDDNVTVEPPHPSPSTTVCCDATPVPSFNPVSGTTVLPFITTLCGHSGGSLPRFLHCRRHGRGSNEGALPSAINPQGKVKEK